MQASRFVTLFFLLFVACGGGTTEAPMSTAEPVPSLPAEVDPLAALNEAARGGAVVDQVHGRNVNDPFRALELDDEATWAWVDAQNGRSEAYFESNADPTRAERLGALLSIGYFGEVVFGGDRVFFTKRDGDAEQASLFAVEPGAEPQLLVDPNGLGDRIAIDFIFPSPGGRYLAYGLSSDGSERSTLHVVDLESGEPLGEAIPHTKWTGLAWLNDDSGFYYTRYPSPGEADYDAENEDVYYRHLFFHALGTDHADDPLIYRVDRTEFIGPSVSEDDAWLVLTVFHSWSQSDVYILDRTSADAVAQPVVVGESFLAYGAVHDGRLLMFSNEGHPRGQILAAAPAAPGDRGDWAVLVPEGEGTIEGFEVAGDRLLVQYVEDIAARLAWFDLDGGSLGDVALPTRGSVGGVSLSHDGSRVAFTFDSFFYPPGLWVAGQGEPTRLDAVAADVDTDAFTLEQQTVTSRDGTDVNVFVVHRRDMVRDGTQPVLLNGYGGFTVSMLPGFARNALYWLEQGGVYAVANIRGGGEYGEAWHQAGMLHNKTNTFDDFEAVIRWLGDSGISSPDRIAITGASNGGLLMGAMITRCPEAFRAAISGVGLYDMVRFTEFPAEIWMGEYGDPANADDFEVLYGYSPYHNVVEGTAYPAVFIETADQDTRVSWKHSTKFAAYLQMANTSDHPILFHMNRAAGHGAGTGLTELVARYVRYYTFIETELGI